MEFPEQIWVLMSRCLSGEASVQEQQQLKAALDNEPQLMQQYEMMTRLWANNPSMEKAGNEEKAVNRIFQLSAAESALQTEDDNAGEEKDVLPLQHNSFRKRTMKYLAIAASLLLPFFLFTVWQSKKETPQVSTSRKIVAQHGSRTRTILPDGSTVVLNAGSKIYYNKDFNGPLREVTLFGEAFFDVAKNPNRPFIVHAGGINIKVLGTAFNVRSYPDDKIFETTLIHGLVQITKANDKKQQAIYLHPNQKFMASYFDTDENDEDENNGNERAESLDTKSFSIKKLDSTVKENERIETAWVYNRLEFRGEDFEALAKKLERWYNISIRFQDDAVKKLRFNGSLEKETMEQAFAALQIAVPFNYSIKGHEIFIEASK
jgi:transmembrane sensor